MKVLCRPLALICAALYLWVGGALFWHEHAPGEPHECAHHAHGEAHTHDADTCSICFFIHTGSIALPGTAIAHEINEKHIVIDLNAYIAVVYEHTFSGLKANKDPPVSS